MIQKYFKKQQLHESSVIVPTVASIQCLNKIVITLDDIPLGYLIAEENNMMIVTDYKDRNKFAIPGCKVITVINGEFLKLFVDLEHHEVENYRME
jgi:hypothetical protein